MPGRAAIRSSHPTSQESTGCTVIRTTPLSNTEPKGATATPAAVTVGLVTRMLREAFEGPPGPWTYFTEAGPGHGLFATLDALTAAQASQTGGPSRSTIAGHVRHLSASLALAARRLRGESGSRDRSQSWSVHRVDEAEWAAVVAEVRSAYHTLRVTVEMRSAWDEDAVGEAFGTIAHVAYHLGAIRQRLERRP